MYRILVVDDEQVITDGLCEILQNTLNYEIEVYKAYSGIEALNILSRTRFDLVISDIRMPGLDGLQLLGRIMEDWPKSRVILLTGHSEFEYVYKAIQYDQVSYILKTEGNRRLIKEVEKQFENIEKEMKSSQLLEEAVRQLKNAERLLQKEYLSSLLRGEINYGVSMQQQFAKLNMPLRTDIPLLLLIAQIDRLPETLSYSSKMQMLFSLKLMTEQYLTPKMIFTGFIDDNNNLVWLLQFTGELSEKNYTQEFGEEQRLVISNLGESMEMVQKACRASLEVTVSFIYSYETFLWDELPVKFSMLKQMLNRHMGISNEVILSENDLRIEKTKLISKNLHYSRSFNENLLGTLITLLEKGDRQKFLTIFDRLMEEMNKDSSLNSLNEQEAYFSISIRLLNYINRWNLSEQIAPQIGLYKLIRPDEHNNWRASAEYLRKLCTIIFDIQQNEQNDINTDTMKNIEKYVHDHIHEDISLFKLAEVVSYNPSYLSRLFKQTRGMNISDYINEEKIKRAKQLLADKSVAINGIAAMVGYNSHANFSRFFKKFTGVTPQEFKNSLHMK